MVRILTAIIAAAMLVGTLVGCSQASADPVEVTGDTVILDVRTPSEYADGHLEGAVLLDLNSGQLAAALPLLDPDVPYVVYCRSGNRSAQAVQLMLDAGFSDVTDLGSHSRAADQTGIAIVR